MNINVLKVPKLVLISKLNIVCDKFSVSKTLVLIFVLFHCFVLTCATEFVSTVSFFYNLLFCSPVCPPTVCIFM